MVGEVNPSNRNGDVTWPHEKAGIHSMGSYTSSRKKGKDPYVA